MSSPRVVSFACNAGAPTVLLSDGTVWELRPDRRAEGDGAWYRWHAIKTLQPIPFTPEDNV